MRTESEESLFYRVGKKMEISCPMRHHVPDLNSEPMVLDETQGNGHGTSCSDRSAGPMIRLRSSSMPWLNQEDQRLSVWSSTALNC